MGRRSGLLIGWVCRSGSSEEKRSYMYQKGIVDHTWKDTERLEAGRTQNENAKKKRRKAHPKTNI
jgi:hypothetical protein